MRRDVAAGGSASSGRGKRRKLYLVNYWRNRYVHAVMAIIGGIVLENIRLNLRINNFCKIIFTGKVEMCCNGKWPPAKQPRVAGTRRQGRTQGGST